MNNRPELLSAAGLLSCLTLLTVSSSSSFADTPAPAQPTPQPAAPAAGQQQTGISEVAAKKLLSLSIEDKPRSAFDVILGNGTPAGYLLNHANILPESISVRCGVILMTAGKDYTLDAANGSLTFTRPIKPSESLRIRYRYKPNAELVNQMSMPGLQVGLGDSTSLGLMFGGQALSTTGTTGNAAATGLTGDLSYGLTLKSAFGSDKQSSLNSVVFFSNAPTSQSLTATPTTANPTSDSKQFMLQSLNVASGGFNVHANYQDIGKGFNGFQALKANNGNRALYDQLEGEKGIKRLGFGLGMNLDPAGKQSGGLSLDWNQISDGKGSINQETAAFASGGMHFQYNQREVGKDYESFTGLREADKAQWARERGLKSSTMGLGFDFGSGPKGASKGGLNFSSMQFGDTSGGFNRAQWSLSAGSTHFSMLNRKSDIGFTRLNDLSDADKKQLALDLRLQYDPKATEANVTPADIAEVGREAGLSRNGMMLNTDLDKKGASGIAYSQTRVQGASATDNSSEFSRSSLSLTLSNLEVSMINRKTSLGFGRIGDLSDIEKNYIALDIRRQFDPNATIDQVTQPERDLATKEIGLSRNINSLRYKLGKDGKNGTFAFSQALVTNEIAAGTAATDAPSSNQIKRQTMALNTRSWQLGWYTQEIGTGFQHLADLSTVEHAQYANEHGLKKSLLTLNMQLNKTSKMNFSSLSVGGSQDAIAAAAYAAEKSGNDMVAAAKAAAGGFSRNSISLDTKNFAVTANTAETSKTFDRATDMALTDAEKTQIMAERGFKRSDFTTRLALLKGMTLDSYFYDANNAEDKLEHKTSKNTVNYSPNKLLAFNMLDDSDLSLSDGKQNGYTRSQMTLNKNFGKNMLLNYYSDHNTTYQNDVVTQDLNTEQLKFQTDQSKPNAVSYLSRQTSMLEGKYENQSDLNVHVKPVKTLGITYTKSDIDRGEDPSENNDRVDIEWHTTKKFAILAGMGQKETNNDNDAKILSLGLSGEPVPNFTLTAKFDELHQVSKNTKNQADISLSNTKPFKFGIFKNLTITARYAAANDLRKLQNETMTGKASWSIWKNEFLLDYGGFTNPDGTSSISRLYQFTTDTNPKRWFHGGFLYKVKTMLDGHDYLVRRYTMDNRLGSRTHLTFLFGTLPEDEKGNIMPTNTNEFALRQQISASQTLSFLYRSNGNDGTKTLTRSLGFDFETKLGSKGKLVFGLSRETYGFVDKYYNADQVRFAYDNAISHDYSLGLSLTVRQYQAGGPPKEATGTFDLRKRF